MLDKETVTFFVGEDIYTVPLEDTSLDFVGLEEVWVYNTKLEASEIYIMGHYRMKVILRDILYSEVTRMEEKARRNRADIIARQAKKETYKIGSAILEKAVFNKIEPFYPTNIEGKRGYEEVYLFFESQVFSWDR